MKINVEIVLSIVMSYYLLFQIQVQEFYCTYLLKEDDSSLEIPKL